MRLSLAIVCATALAALPTAASAQEDDPPEPQRYLAFAVAPTATPLCTWVVNKVLQKLAEAGIDAALLPDLPSQEEYDRQLQESIEAAAQAQKCPPGVGYGPLGCYGGDAIFESLITPVQQSNLDDATTAIDSLLAVGCEEPAGPGCAPGAGEACAAF